MLRLTLLKRWMAGTPLANRNLLAPFGIKNATILRNLTYGSKMTKCA